MADSLRPIGRAQLSWLNQEQGLLTWINQAGELLVQAFDAKRLVGQPLRVGRGLSDRKSGFPQLISPGDTAYLAWTRPAGGITLRKLYYGTE